MSKIITDDELLEVVKQAISQKDKTGQSHSWRHQTHPDLAYREFLQAVGNAVASYYGGEMLMATPPDEIMDKWTLLFGWDPYVPQNGGVWAIYDDHISVAEWRKETAMTGFELHTVNTVNANSTPHL